MNSVVCISHVPDTESRIKVAGNRIDEAGLKFIVSPYDEFALEEAIRLAAANNERAKIARLQVDAAEGELEIARSDFLPSLTFGASVTAQPWVGVVSPKARLPIDCSVCRSRRRWNAP